MKHLLVKYWQRLSIAAKFTYAFGVLFGLMLLVSLVGYISLTLVRRQTEFAIVTSAEIQRLVLEIDVGLQSVRRSERDFLLYVPKVGFADTRPSHVWKADARLNAVAASSAELHQLIDRSDVCSALRKRQAELNFYLSAAERYRDALHELVGLMSQLSDLETGLEARLSQTASTLREPLYALDDHVLLGLLFDMLDAEKAYFTTRQRPRMQTVFNIVSQLRQAIEEASFPEDTQAYLTHQLDEYLTIAEEMLELNVEIRSKFNEFDLQADAIDPIAEELVELARGEVEQARLQIQQTSHLVTVLLAATAVTGLLFTGIIARVLHHSITRNVLSLTQSAVELQNGNLEVAVQIQSGDELGQLAGAFNAMTDRLRELVKTLEQKVAQRTAELAESNQDLERTVVELKQAKETAEKAQQGAEAANRAKSEFLANMSHELRTPMNSILGFSDMLDNVLHEPQQRHYLGYIQTAGKTLLTLINDVLDLSKIEAGKLELSYSPVSLAELREEMSVIFSHRIAEKGLEFVCEIGPDLPNTLLLDELRMRQILLNLLGNAVKFTERGIVALRIARLPDEEPSHGSERSTLVNFQIEVEDTGIGIAPELQERIFDAFEQEKGEHLHRYGGTGLGLAIVKRLVNMLGGQIQVRSESGKGSRFTVIFREIETAGANAVTHQRTQGVDPALLDFEPATILIADDIDYNRELLRGFLAPYAFEILEAANGQEVLEQSSSHRPDLILLDMKMPEMDGDEVASWLRQNEALKGIPLVAVTASALKEDEKRIRELCDEYLRKPVCRMELLRVLAACLPYTLKKPLVPEEATGDNVGLAYTVAPEPLILLKPLAPQLREALEVMEIGELQNIVDKITAIAEKYEQKPVLSWATRMQDALRNFDVPAVERMVTTFLSLLDEPSSLEHAR